MNKSTKTQKHKNTKVTIHSELSLYRRTGNSTHARCIADRLVMGVELGNIDAQFLLDLESRLSLVPHGAAVDREALVNGDYRGDYISHDDGHHMSW